jgi:hypothetical protein
MAAERKVRKVKLVRLWLQVRVLNEQQSLNRL